MHAPHPGPLSRWGVRVYRAHAKNWPGARDLSRRNAGPRRRLRKIPNPISLTNIPAD